MCIIIIRIRVYPNEICDGFNITEIFSTFNYTEHEDTLKNKPKHRVLYELNKFLIEYFQRVKIAFSEPTFFPLKNELNIYFIPKINITNFENGKKILIDNFNLINTSRKFKDINYIDSIFGFIKSFNELFDFYHSRYSGHKYFYSKEDVIQGNDIIMNKTQTIKEVFDYFEDTKTLKEIEINEIAFDNDEIIYDYDYDYEDNSDVLTTPNNLELAVNKYTLNYYLLIIFFN